MFARGRISVPGSRQHNVIHQLTVFCLCPALSVPLLPPVCPLVIFLSSPSCLLCIAPAVRRRSDQSDGALGFNASVGRGVSRREGQGGVGEGAGGGEEERPQAHRNSKTGNNFRREHLSQTIKTRNHILMFLHRSRSCSSLMKSAQAAASSSLKEPTSTTPSPASLRCIYFKRLL